MDIKTEKAFETAIVESLVENGGYAEGNASDYSPELGMYKYEVLAFLQETQSPNWRKLSTIRNDDVDNRVIQRFIHLQTDEIEVDLSASGDGKAGGKTIKKEKMIFPRYHQLDSVRKITADAKQAGTGKNYLVQHSAGSGKSNSIAWLSYRLSSLHMDKSLRLFSSNNAI